MASRGAFNSRIGFVMAAVGSAVGLGNLWRFPQMVSQNGGAAFVMLYLLLLFVIGLPALLAELSIGRHRQKDAVRAFSPDAKGRSYSWVGFLFLGTAVLLLSYYSVIAGQALRYMVESSTAPYFDNPAGYYASIQSGPAAIAYHAIFMAITLIILTRGVSKGIEKANLIMMPMLFASVVGIAIYGLLQTGAVEGIKFYLTPDAGALTEGGFSGAAALWSDAAGQTFFSIGLGLGTMLTYASYINRDNNLQNTGLTVGFADTGVAILAGFMVFPLLFGLGLGGLAEEGNGLFVALPAAFASVGGVVGGLLAFVFFLLLTFAALSSALSLLEVPVSYVIDRFPTWGRTRAVLVMGLAVYMLGLPAAIWPDWLGFADSMVTPLLLAGGFLLVWYAGWVDRDILDELSIGSKSSGRVWKGIIRYPLPVVLGLLFLLSVVSFFDGLGA